MFKLHLKECGFRFNNRGKNKNIFVENVLRKCLYYCHGLKIIKLSPTKKSL
jgi:hypothetical protein